MTINRGSTTTGTYSALWRILPPPGWSSSPGPGGRLLLTCEDKRTLRISFHSLYFCPSGRIDWGYTSVAKQLRRGQQPDYRWPPQGGRHIPRVFPFSGFISTALSYNDPGRIFTGGPPSAKRGDRGAVSLQDRLPPMASSPLQRTSPEAGFRGRLYCNNVIAQLSSSHVSSNPNEWHTHGQWENPKNPQKTINNVDSETSPLCWV